MQKPRLLDQVRQVSRVRHTVLVPKRPKFSGSGWGVWPLVYGYEQFVDLLQRTFEVVSTVCFEGHTGKSRHAAQFVL